MRAQKIFTGPARMIGRGARPMYRSARTGKLRLWPIFLFGIFAVYFYFSNQEIVPLTGRTQLVDISRQQEIALGLQSFQQVLKQESVITHGPERDFVDGVASRLVPVIKEAEYDWQFELIQSTQANAFALPGGKVAVYSGILPVAKNEDGLAAIVGHEIAHVVARHGAERMAHQKLLQLGSMAAAVSVGEMEPQTQRMVLGAFGLGSQFGIMLPFSRDHESEADYMGLIFLARACFDPSEAPLLWERMAESSDGKRPMELLSTHPDPKKRAAQIRKWLPEIQKIRQEHCS